MSTQIHIQRIATQRPAGKGFLQFLVAANAVWQQRRSLARLDIDALNDIGLTQSEARREAAKPFWDLPNRGCK